MSFLLSYSSFPYVCCRFPLYRFVTSAWIFMSFLLHLFFFSSQHLFFLLSCLGFFLLEFSLHMFIFLFLHLIWSFFPWRWLGLTDRFRVGMLDCRLGWLSRYHFFASCFSAAALLLKGMCSSSSSMIFFSWIFFFFSFSGYFFCSPCFCFSVSFVGSAGSRTFFIGVLRKNEVMAGCFSSLSSGKGGSGEPSVLSSSESAIASGTFHHVSLFAPSCLRSLPFLVLLGLGAQAVLLSMMVQPEWRCLVPLCG